MADLFEEIAPGVGLIAAIRAERSPLYLWAGEAIDNSLDASATLVELTIDADELKASDNGHGITKAHDTAIVRIAQHIELQGTKLGRFGVGIKYKAIQHGKILQIKSVSRDGLMTRRVDWSSIEKIGRWMVPPPDRSPSSADPGTVVSIRNLFKKPTKAEITRTISETERRYYPAIETGTVIGINDEPVDVIPRPPLSDVVQASRLFPDGREAMIYGGMLADPSSSKLRQVDLIVGYRVIKPECSFGCNGYGGIRSMFARIDLLGNWKLTKFKDDIAEDPHEEELENWAEEVLRPILEKCQSASMALKTRNLQDILNDMLPDRYRVSRPEQKQQLGRKGAKSGKKAEPSDKHKDTPSGPVPKKRSPRGIIIEFAEGLNEKHGYGRADFSSKSVTRIQLAADNPHVRELVSSRDQRQAAIGLYMTACLIYEGDLNVNDPRLAEECIGIRAWRIGEQQVLPNAEAAE